MPRAAASCGFIVEYSVGANPLLHELIEESFVVEHGMAEIPDRPGLGIDFDPDALERFAQPEG